MGRKALILEVFFMGRPKNSKNRVVRLVPSPAYNYDAAAARYSNTIGERLTNARKKANLKQSDVATLLSQMGIPCQAGAVSKWEKGENVPSGYVLIALCIALHIEDGISYFSGHVISAPVRLNVTGQRLLKNYEEFLVASGQYRPVERIGRRKETPFYESIQMPVSEIGASAGLGELLGDEQMTMESFPAPSVPDGADFGIYVDGDSMEPVYHDKELVWVQRTQDLRPGEVGIFIYDDCGYIKLLETVDPSEEEIAEAEQSGTPIGPKPVLVSYNSEYEPIEILPDLRFDIIGRVLT